MACPHVGSRGCYICDPCATCTHPWHGLPCPDQYCACPGPWADERTT